MALFRNSRSRPEPDLLNKSFLLKRYLGRSMQTLSAGAARARFPCGCLTVGRRRKPGRPSGTGCGPNARSQGVVGRVGMELEGTMHRAREAIGHRGSHSEKSLIATIRSPFPRI